MRDQLTLTIPAPTGLNRSGKMTALWLNTNDRSHWTRRARLARQWRTLALQYARLAKLPTGLEHAHITATIHKTRAGRWDAHNLLPTVKHAIDGLVDYGLLEDDDNTRLTGPDMRAGEPRPQACIILTITPGRQP